MCRLTIATGVPAKPRHPEKLLIDVSSSGRPKEKANKKKKTSELKVIVVMSQTEMLS